MAATKKKTSTKASSMAWEVQLGDCVKELHDRSMRERDAAKFPFLWIADPPYDFGHPYEAHDDNLGYEEYIAFTHKWLTAVYNAMHPHGSLFVFAPREWVSEIDMFAKHELKLHQRGHIAWAFTFGQAAQNNFTRAHCHILYYTKHKTRYTFNDEAIRIPSWRQLHGDRRANPAGKLPDDVWLLSKEAIEDGLPVSGDVWLQSRVCGTFHARVKDVPNQLPVPLLERIVLACSKPGEVICDPFCGSGSAAKAALQHGRRFLGIDNSPKCVQITVKACRELEKR